jgi:hypothetical protein
MEVRCQLHTPADLLPGKDPPHPLGRRFGGPQSRSVRYGEDKNFAPAGNRTPVIQPVARHYTDWAIPTFSKICYST